MLFLLFLPLLPALAVGGLNTRAGTTTSVNLVTMPSCAITCTLQIGPTTPCPDPSDLNCICTTVEYQVKVGTCYQKTCNNEEFRAGITMWFSSCASAGHPLDIAAINAAALTATSSRSGTAKSTTGSFNSTTGSTVGPLIPVNSGANLRAHI